MRCGSMWIEEDGGEMEDAAAEEAELRAVAEEGLEPARLVDAVVAEGERGDAAGEERLQVLPDLRARTRGLGAGGRGECARGRASHRRHRDVSRPARHVAATKLAFSSAKHARHRRHGDGEPPAGRGRGEREDRRIRRDDPCGRRVRACGGRRGPLGREGPRYPRAKARIHRQLAPRQRCAVRAPADGAGRDAEPTRSEPEAARASNASACAASTAASRSEPAS